MVLRSGSVGGDSAPQSTQWWIKLGRVEFLADTVASRPTKRRAALRVKSGPTQRSEKPFFA
jgi:hypothetical protein